MYQNNQICKHNENFCQNICIIGQKVVILSTRMIKLNKKDEKYSASTPPRTRLYKITFVHYPGFYPVSLFVMYASRQARASISLCPLRRNRIPPLHLPTWQRFRRLYPGQKIIFFDKYPLKICIFHFFVVPLHRFCIL